MRLKFRSFCAVFLVFLAVVGQASGQATTASPAPTPVAARPGTADPRVRSSVLDSKLMARKIPYRVVLPQGYDTKEEASRRYPVIYLLHGLTGNFANWTDRTKLSEYAAAFKLIVVTPDGENGWYTDSLSKPNDRYESYIIKELIPEVDRKYRTLSRREHRAIAGLSMGGYGAVKFGLKYPELFRLAGSFSGAVGAASITEAQFPGAVGKTIDGIFGPVGSDTRRSNDLFDMVRSMTPELMKAIPFLYIDCGTEDFLFQNNRDFIALLVEKGVPHEYRQLPGAHNWAYWDKQVQELLLIANRTFTTAEPKSGTIQ